MANSYSFNELVGISNSIHELLKKSKETKYDRKLLFGLNKNLKKAQEELEQLREQLLDPSEKYQEYITKLQYLAVECGGVREIKDTQQIVKTEVEGFDKKKFDKEGTKLSQEYKDVIDEANKLETQNRKFMAEKAADVDWQSLKLDWFPENVSIEDMPYEITDLIIIE